MEGTVPFRILKGWNPFRILKVTVPTRSVFLIGPMGSGKTAVGKALARRLGRKFVDSDAEIESRTGVDIAYIFEREGEEGFRIREREVIDAVTDGITDLASVPVESRMTQRATALKPTDTIASGLHMMAVHGFRHVPLVDEAGRPVGILASRRVVEYIEQLA